MDGKILQQLWRDHFAVETLLQHIKGLHAAVAQHQQFAVDGERSMMPKSVKRFSGIIMLRIKRILQWQRREQVWKALGDVLAAARIQPRLDVAALVAASDRLHPNAVPFPFRDEVGGRKTGKIRILDRMR